MQLIRLVGLFTYTAIMKALTGEPPMSFIRKLRLHKAKTLLQTTELNVSEIAYDLGFTDPHYFSRAFKKEFGMPPSDLRTQQNGSLLHMFLFFNAISVHSLGSFVQPWECCLPVFL